MCSSMELTAGMFFIVCPLVFLAGLIDSIAGGGGLISLPAYLMAGLPAHFALGTNKLSSIAGTALASVRYYRNKFVDLIICLPSVAAALAGSAAGSYFALFMKDYILNILLLIVIPVTAFYVFKKKNLDIDASSISRKKMIIFSVIISFFIGGYDGFAGPGTGTFLILLYNGIAKIDSRIATGNAKFVNFASNLSALVLFLINGRVLVILGICGALFNMLGAYIGSGLVISKGTKVIRYTIIAVLAVIYIKLIFDIINRGLPLF